MRREKAHKIHIIVGKLGCEETKQDYVVVEIVETSIGDSGCKNMV